MSFFSEHGGTLFLGSTAVLAIACIAVALSRVPVHQKRIGELAVWGVLAFLFLSVVPLPRLLMSDGPRTPAEPISSSPAAVTRFSGEDEQLLASTGAFDVAEVPGTILAIDPAVLVDSGTVAVMTATPPPPAPAITTWSRPLESGSEAPLLDTLATFYLVGGGLCLLWLLAGLLYLLLVLGRARPAPQWVRDLLVEEGPKVLVTPYRCRPFCIGWRRGTIVLPARLVYRHRQEQIRQVLLHEVGHLQQSDLLGQLPLALLLPVLFFNPLFWWLRARMRLASELLADDFAARRSTRTAYARELIALAEEDARHLPAPLGAASILRSPSEFYRRIKMLLEREETLITRCSRWRNALQTSVAAVLVVGLSSMGGVTAQDRVEETIQAIRKQLEALQEENVKLRLQLEEAQREKNSRGFFDVLSNPLLRSHPMSPPRSVTVRRGDDFKTLIEQNGADPEKVKLLNPGLDPLKLRVGQEILLPGPVPRGGSTEPSLLKGLLNDPKLGSMLTDQQLSRVLNDIEMKTTYMDPDLGPLSASDDFLLGLVGGVAAGELPQGPVGGPGAGGPQGPGGGPSAGGPSGPGVGPTAGGLSGLVGGPTTGDPLIGVPGGSTATGAQPRSRLLGVTDPLSPSAGLPQAQTFRASPGPILDSATLQLMNQAIDLQTEIENGEEEVKRNEELAADGLVSRRDINQARNSLRGSMRKHELILKMIEAEIQVTEQELQLLTEHRDQYAKDSTPYREVQGQIQRLHHRLEILGSVR